MIHIKSDAEIRLMRKAGQILAQAFEAAAPLMVAGTNADDVDKIVEETIRSNNAIPAFKNHPNADGVKFPIQFVFRSTKKSCTACRADARSRTDRLSDWIWV